MNKLSIALLLFALAACDDPVKRTTELEGYWIWKSTCGGFAGCFYPSQNNTQKLLIGETQIQIVTDDELTFSKEYTLTGVTETDASTLYKLKFDDDETWTTEVSNNQLTIHHNSVITSVYERLL